MVPPFRNPLYLQRRSSILMIFLFIARTWIFNPSGGTPKKFRAPSARGEVSLLFLPLLPPRAKSGGLLTPPNCGNDTNRGGVLITRGGFNKLNTTDAQLTGIDEVVPDFLTSVTFISPALYWEMRGAESWSRKYPLGDFKWTPRSAYCDFFGVLGL